MNIEILKFINQISIINFILLVWFKTSAFVEYSKLLGLKKIFKIDNYLEYKKTNNEIDYLSYLLIKHEGFFSKLLNCPYCLNFYITLISCLIFFDIKLYFIIYMSSILVFRFLEIYIYG